MTVPGDMIANDAFLYFSCITKGFLFRHVSGAQVWFTSPKISKIRSRQNKRFIASHYRLERIFGPVVPAEYHVPTFLAYKLQLREFVRAPFSSLAVFLINLYCKARAKRDEKKMNAKWLMAHSTKEEIASLFLIRMSMNILIPNATGPNNIGDQAALRALISLLRAKHKEATIIIHSSNPELYRKKSLTKCAPSVFLVRFSKFKSFREDVSSYSAYSSIHSYSFQCSVWFGRANTRRHTQGLSQG